MLPASVCTPAPPVRFLRRVQRSKSGPRVVWESRRDSLHHPQSFEVVASAAGVRVCGHSPALDIPAMWALADILAQASVCVELIRDGFDAGKIELVLSTHDHKNPVKE